MSSPKSQRFVVSVEVNTNNNLLKSQNDEEDAWRARATEKCVGTIKWKLFLVRRSISTCLSFFLSFFTRGFARVEDDAHISHDDDESVAQGNGIMSSRPFVGT